GRGLADVDHVAARARQAAGERRRELRSRKAPVAADHEAAAAARPGLRADGDADALDEVGSEAVPDDAADVVGLEDLGGRNADAGAACTRLRGHASSSWPGATCRATGRARARKAPVAHAAFRRASASLVQPG